MKLLRNKFSGKRKPFLKHWSTAFYLKLLRNKFSGKRKPFLKNWSTAFYLKLLIFKTHYFHSKLLSQKPMLRQIESWVQNGPITKKGVLPATSLFFLKFCFSLRTCYKELI